MNRDEKEAPSIEIVDSKISHTADDSGWDFGGNTVRISQPNVLASLELGYALLQVSCSQVEALLPRRLHRQAGQKAPSSMT